MTLYELAPVLFSISFICLPLASWGEGPQADGGGSTSPALHDVRPIDEAPWPGLGVCYGPHRDGQWPGGPTPTAAQIRQDLQIMRPHWSALRLYGSAEFARKVLNMIRAGGLDMKVMLGVWIAPEKEPSESGAALEPNPDAAAANRREADAAIALAAEYPDIVLAVCVGNETQVFWSPHPTRLETLITHIRRVREAVAVPVTTADDYLYWIEPQSRRLAQEVDFITVHAHPLWNGKQLGEALPWLRDQVAAVQSVHPERPVVIGETGWATSVADEGEEARLIKGTPGEIEQATFYTAVKTWASAEGVPTFFFEAFDENWKGADNPDEVEKHWGLYRVDRTPKAAVKKR
ncbi:MAG: glycosyl hydrolase [Candidatus Eisenbacteria bacterium]|nr:glycosyl hydrolase [Candidatus Eisenbacteria bacterium]